MGDNYNAGSTAEEMAEFYGDPSNGDYDPEHVAAVEGMLRDDALMRENARLRDENELLRSIIDDEGN
jgi:hypothetical protein